MGEFDVEAQHTERSQNKRNIGVRYAGKKLLPRRHQVWLYASVTQVESRRRTIEALNRLAVKRYQNCVRTVGNGVNQMAFQSFTLGVGLALPHPGFRQLNVAAAFFRKAAHVSRGVILNLGFHSLADFGSANHHGVSSTSVGS